MAEKVASVKLTLNGSSFTGSLKQVGLEGEKSAKKVESAFKKSAVAGLNAMKSAATSTASSIKSTIQMVAGLGGALSLAEGVKGAIDLRGQFKNIAFAIRAGTGEAADWQSMMLSAQEQAKKWGQSSEELGASFKRVFQETGDAKFAEAAMSQIAEKARATGESIDTLTEITGKMNDKFGITAKELPDALTAAFSLANQGGIKFDEMGERLGLIGASAKLAGIQGVDGFKKIVGMANIAKESSGTLKKALTGVTGLLDQMGSPEHAKKIGQVFGVMTKDAKGAQKDTTKILGEIFAKTGGKKEMLARGFEGEQLKVVNDLGSVFRETFEKTTGTVQQKTKAALAAYEATLTKAGQSAITNADMEAKALDKMQSPQAQMAVAMERLKEAFTSPEMMTGLLRLAKLAPEAANKMANLLHVAFDHPAMAVGIYGGIKLGVPFLTGALSAGAKSIASAMIGAAPGIGKMLLNSGATDAFTPSGAVAGVGSKAAGAVMNVAAVAAAGVAGYAAGDAYAQHVIDPAVNRAQQTKNSLGSATLAADLNISGKSSVEQDKATLENLRQRLDEARKSKAFGADDIYTLGMKRLGTASDDEVAKGQAAYDKGVAALEQKMGPAAEKTAASLSDVNDGLKALAKTLQGIAPGAGGAAPGAGGGASRGPIQRGPVTAGYVPR